MMKELLVQYADYNIWANKLIIDAISKLDDDKIDAEIASSFPSLRKTIYHVWSAESVWLQRLQHAEHTIWHAAHFDGSFSEACNEWHKSSQLLADFVRKQLNDNALIHVLEYHDLKMNVHKTPVFQVLHHVFNHSTFHRGQLITMLRQAGATELPSTDFITYARMKG